LSYLLFVDDDHIMLKMASAILSEAGHEVATASHGRDALTSLEQREPDLVVLDVDMPQMGGLDVCRVIKSNPFTSRIPILMLTGRSGIDAKIEGFDAGADDYLPKPFHPRELKARVSALLRLVRRESDRNPTSGLPGAGALREAIDKRAAESKRTGEKFAICYIDLDGFKPFADTFGFAAADAVILRTGQALSKTLEEIARRNGEPPPGVPPSRHFAGHIGGDDFLILTTENRAEEIAADCAERFREVVAEVLGEEAVSKGTFTGVDREGRVQEFPIATLTSVILLVDPEQWISVAHVGAFAAELKRNAKAIGNGSIITHAA
jgi:diguanylate cyclase (GGDEF)-like protein